MNIQHAGEKNRKSFQGCRSKFKVIGTWHRHICQCVASRVTLVCSTWIDEEWLLYKKAVANKHRSNYWLLSEDVLLFNISPRMMKHFAVACLCAAHLLLSKTESTENWDGILTHTEKHASQCNFITDTNEMTSPKGIQTVSATIKVKRPMSNMSTFVELK